MCGHVGTKCVAKLTGFSLAKDVSTVAHLMQYIVTKDQPTYVYFFRL